MAAEGYPVHRGGDREGHEDDERRRPPPAGQKQHQDRQHGSRRGLARGEGTVARAGFRDLPGGREHIVAAEGDDVVRAGATERVLQEMDDAEGREGIGPENDENGGRPGQACGSSGAREAAREEGQPDGEGDPGRQRPVQIAQGEKNRRVRQREPARPLGEDARCRKVEAGCREEEAAHRDERGHEQHLR